MRNAIHDMRFKSGQRLTEQEICQQMNVSRTPVREAFRTLQVEGYLTYKPRYGVIVTELSEKDIEELCEVRIYLEELIARKTARNADEKLKSKIRAEMSRINKALSQEKLEKHVFIKLSESYNNIHLGGCDNKILQDLAEKFRVNSTLLRRNDMLTEERRRRFLKEIADVYAAYLDNDEERAAECNRIHFLSSLEEIKRLCGRK